MRLAGLHVVLGVLPALVAAAGLGGLARASPRVVVGPAEIAPLLAPAPGESRVRVQAFSLDPQPVNNAQFEEFVRKSPQWRRDRVPALFADADYLSHWAGPGSPDAPGLPDQPVTRVSWFAARAYCAAAGGRLPSWYEWELAVAANGPAAAAKPGVPRSPTWEWVEDFGSLMVSGDSRDQGDPDKLAFCGAGALSAQDRENYPLLMHVAFLSALEGRSTARSLGFRCAADLETKLQEPPRRSGLMQPNEVAAASEPPQWDQPGNAVADVPGDSLYQLDVPLETAGGARISLSSFRGHPLLITLFYSRCTNVCPMITNQLAQIEQQLAPRLRAQVRVLMVSFDAARDSPEALDAFEAMHTLDKSRWTVARPRPVDVRALAAVLGVRYRELPDHSFNHSSVIVLADRAGVVRARQAGARGIDPDFVAAVRSVTAGRVATRPDDVSSRRRR